MRSIVLITLAVFTAAEAFAQGTVDFRNYLYYFFTNRVVDTPFFDEQGVRLEGSRYVAQLYSWRAGEGFRAEGSPVTFATNTYSGYFLGGTVVLPGVPGNSEAWIQVRAWKPDGGTTFEEAALAGVWTGSSEVLYIFVGCPYCVPPSLPARLIGLTYPGPPLIVRQPQSHTIPPGESATLSVIASSGVLKDYQWYKRPSNRPDILIPGATNATYTILGLTNNITFWVSVANSAGSVLSDEATVTVLTSAPQLSLEQADGLPVLTLSGLVGFTYRIEYSTNLSTTNWTHLVELSLSASPFTFSDSSWSNSPARYYRAVAP